jgi:nucleotide-binding universal stress UspA family protein
VSAPALRRILVGLDGSPLAETILDLVRALAQRLGADVVLFHAIHVPEAVGAAEQGPGLDEVIEQERARARAYLDRAAARAAGRGYGVQSVVRVGDAAREIVGWAARERIDLIALATHGRSGMQRWIYGSVADAVLHATTTPLLLFRPVAGGAAAAPDVRRVVVPLDGSLLAEGALPTASALARALDAPLVLVRVVEFVGLAFGADPLAGPYLDYQGILAVLRKDAERYLEEAAAHLRGKGLAVEIRAPVGIPADTITALAREEAGTLVVLSTHGRSGWRAVVLGSVARRVALLASGPVLVMRPAGARSDSPPGR